MVSPSIRKLGLQKLSLPQQKKNINLSKILPSIVGITSRLVRSTHVIIWELEFKPKFIASWCFLKMNFKKLFIGNFGSKYIMKKWTSLGKF
jgi:hypothetical protein